MGTRRRWKRILLRILLVLGALWLTVLLVGALLQHTLFRAKFDQVRPHGRMVRVADGEMHLLGEGTGAHTVVLLPGMGVALPSADYGPLRRELAKDHEVVVVEYFGTGHSSITSVPRTSANYVEEVREALRQAGYEPPYVLMAHSISSLYAEYYAATYPKEVEAVISLDGTSSAFYQETPAIVNAVLPLAKVQHRTGATSLLARLITNRQQLRTYGYTDGEIGEMIAFAGFSINGTLLEQIRQSGEFVRQTQEKPYPPEVSYLKIISRDTYGKPNKQLPMPPQEYQEQHLTRIGVAQSVILEGNHFIYLNNTEEIARLTKEFLGQRVP